MYVKFSPGTHIRGNRLRLIFPKIATMDVYYLWYSISYLECMWNLFWHYIILRHNIVPRVFLSDRNLACIKIAHMHKSHQHYDLRSITYTHTLYLFSCAQIFFSMALSQKALKGRHWGAHQVAINRAQCDVSRHSTFSQRKTLQPHVSSKISNSTLQKGRCRYEYA